MSNRNYGLVHDVYNRGDIKVRKRVSQVDSSELTRLLKLVYVPDKRTGLPTGELTVLASDTVSPDIANWVRTQLLNPLPNSGVSSVVDGHQIDDDTLVALTRNPLESDRSYIARVDGLLREWNKTEESLDSSLT